MHSFRFLGLTLAAALIFAPGAAHGQQGEQRAKVIQLSGDRAAELKTSVGVDDLWNSTPEALVESGDAIIAIRSYDSDAAPSMGKRLAAALVMVGVRGTGVVPVALNFYARDGGELHVTAGSAPRSFIVSLRGGRDIQIQVDGSNSVLLDGAVVGKIG